MGWMVPIVGVSLSLNTKPIQLRAFPIALYLQPSITVCQLVAPIPQERQKASRTAKMRFSLALFSVGLASLVAGQSQTDISSLVSQIPSCAVSCLDTAATSAGCATSDFNCRCDKSAVIGASSGACLARSCSVDDVGGMSCTNI